MNIQGLLEQEVFQWGATVPVDVYGENMAAPNEYPDSFVQVAFLPAETATLTTNGIEDFSGIMQLSIFTRKGAGTQDGRAITASSLAHFSKNLNISGVRVVKSYQSPSINDQSWYVTPVSINYRVLS